MTDVQKAAVDYLKDAKPGDTVWKFDSQQALRVDGKYLGRGVWSLSTIDAETRKSFMIARVKFDRKTGVQMATGNYAATLHIAGQAEYEGAQWMKEHGYSFISKIQRETDIAVLKQIAAIVGYKT